jgi:uncharacterized lipoprotein YddW (UPF0748 family)
MIWGGAIVAHLPTSTIPGSSGSMFSFFICRPKRIFLVLFFSAITAVILLGTMQPGAAQGQPSNPTGNWANSWIEKFSTVWGNQIHSNLTQSVADEVSQTPLPSHSRPEIRGAWLTNIDSDVLYNHDRLNSALKELSRLQFNTVYPAIWTWGHTLYNSPTAKKAFGTAIEPVSPLEPSLKLNGRDVLADTVKLGHQQGLAVIPWFEFGFMTTADSTLVRRHPDWFTTRRNGSRIWREGKYDRVWLNPFHPKAQQFILDLITEIVTKYDVDGIQLDDHFGLPFEFGYDAYTTRLYQKEHRNRLPPRDPKDPEWTRWRADKITAFLTRVFKTVKAHKNDVLIALSPNSQKFSYEHSLADWQTWERRGLVEELMLQVYRSSLDSFKAELAQPEVVAARNHIPVGIGILSGLKERTVPMSQIQEQVQTVRDRNFAGVSFFFYETMWNLSGEPADTRKTVFQQLFATPVQRPSVYSKSQKDAG